MGFPERQTSSVAWELRTHWATGREVVLVLDTEWAEIPRVAGRIVRVATSGTFALVDDGGATAIHVPLAIVLAVRRPHFTEPLDNYAVVPDSLDGQLVLVYPDG